MSKTVYVLNIIMLLLATGCAHIDFDSQDKGMTFFDPKPY
jgi:hypothetical protein